VSLPQAKPDPVLINPLNYTELRITTSFRTKHHIRETGCNFLASANNVTIAITELYSRLQYYAPIKIRKPAVITLTELINTGHKKPSLLVLSNVQNKNQFYR